MLLHKLVTTKKAELLSRSRARLQEASPRPGAAELERWLVVLVDLLAGALEREERSDGRTEPGQVTARTREVDDPASSDHPRARVSRYCAEIVNAVAELLLEESTALTAAQFEALDRSVTRVIAAAVAELQGERQTVVAVEPDLQVRRLLQQFMEGAYLVEFLEDGLSALDRVRSAAPSVLLTEILVPRLDGLALCRRLKTDPATAHVPVLVCSMLAAEQRAQQSGADAFLEKPLERKRLVASLRSAIDRSRTPEPRDQAAE
jgi:CheY-like chemotaxis protein